MLKHGFRRREREEAEVAEAERALERAMRELNRLR